MMTFDEFRKMHLDPLINHGVAGKITAAFWMAHAYQMLSTKPAQREEAVAFLAEIHALIAKIGGEK